eukprot:scaffold1554_cov401-Prasinococcus_capsulatus_cf.AAC.14
MGPVQLDPSRFTARLAGVYYSGNAARLGYTIQCIRPLNNARTHRAAHPNPKRRERRTSRRVVPKRSGSCTTTATITEATYGSSASELPPSRCPPPPPPRHPPRQSGPTPTSAARVSLARMIPGRERNLP